MRQLPLLHHSSHFPYLVYLKLLIVKGDLVEFSDPLLHRNALAILGDDEDGPDLAQRGRLELTCATNLINLSLIEAQKE